MDYGSDSESCIEELEVDESVEEYSADNEVNEDSTEELRQQLLPLEVLGVKFGSISAFQHMTETIVCA